MGLEEYLTYCVGALEKWSDFPAVHIVLGNETCDLDSAVSAITYAYYLHETSALPVGTAIFLPLLNIPRSQLALRTEVVFLLSKYGITAQHLIFTSDLDLQEVKAKTDLKVTLVDHHVLSPALADLEECVVQIIDHRPTGGSLPDKCESTMELVGSCATLVAEALLMDEQFSVDPVTATLLYGTIVTDTINFLPSAGKTTQKDLDLAEKLEEVIGQGLDRESMFDEIQKAKFDLSGLTVMELLEKDLKLVQGDSLQVAMSSITMSMTTLLSKPDLLESLKKFAALHGVEAVVVMAVAVGYDNDISRQLAVFSPSRVYRQQMADVLSATQSPNLRLSPLPCPHEELLPFEQANVTASRKQVLPIVKGFLAGENTADRKQQDSNLHCSEPEGFTSLTIVGGGRQDTFEDEITSEGMASRGLSMEEEEDANLLSLPGGIGKSKRIFDPLSSVHSSDGVPSPTELGATGSPNDDDRGADHDDDIFTYDKARGDDSLDEKFGDPGGGVDFFSQQIEEDVNAEDSLDAENEENLKHSSQEFVEGNLNRSGEDSVEENLKRSVENSEFGARKEEKGDGGVVGERTFDEGGGVGNESADISSSKEKEDSFVRKESECDGDQTTEGEGGGSESAELSSKKNADSSVLKESEHDEDQTTKIGEGGSQSAELYSLAHQQQGDPAFGDFGVNPPPAQTSSQADFTSLGLSRDQSGSQDQSGFQDQSVSYNQSGIQDQSASQDQSGFGYQSRFQNQSASYDQSTTSSSSLSRTTPEGDRSFNHSADSNPTDSVEDFLEMVSPQDLLFPATDSPLELSATPSGQTSGQASTAPSYPVTPPNSYMDGGGLLDKMHLPSFNSSEMVEKIQEKKASLPKFNVDSDDADLDLDPQVNPLSPFTPHNSYVDTGLGRFHPEANLPSFHSSDMVQRIREKRSSMERDIQGSGAEGGDLDLLTAATFTPHNSFVDGSGLEEYIRQHHLPSLNNAEIAERIRQRQAELAVAVGDASDTGAASPGFLQLAGTTPYTPQNSYRDLTLTAQTLNSHRLDLHQVAEKLSLSESDSSGSLSEPKAVKASNRLHASSSSSSVGGSDGGIRFQVWEEPGTSSFGDDEDEKEGGGGKKVTEEEEEVEEEGEG